MVAIAAAPNFLGENTPPRSPEPLHLRPPQPTPTPLHRPHSPTIRRRPQRPRPNHRRTPSRADAVRCLAPPSQRPWVAGSSYGPGGSALRTWPQLAIHVGGGAERSYSTRMPQARRSATARWKAGWRARAGLTLGATTIGRSTPMHSNSMLSTRLSAMPAAHLQTVLMVTGATTIASACGQDDSGSPGLRNWVLTG